MNSQTKTCLLCKNDVHRTYPGYANVDGGVEFRGRPCYGSGHDFMGEGTLCVYICDGCLKKAAADNAVDFEIPLRRSPRPRAESLSGPWKADSGEDDNAAFLRAQDEQRTIESCKRHLDNLEHGILEQRVFAAFSGPEWGLDRSEFEPLFREWASKGNKPPAPPIFEEDIVRLLDRAYRER